MKHIGKLSALEAALAELIEKPRQANEFTIAEFAGAAGISHDNAGKRLRRDGRYESRSVVLDGHRVVLYRRKTG